MMCIPIYSENNMQFTLFAFLCCKFEFRITRILLQVKIFKTITSYIKNEYINYTTVEIFNDIKKLKYDFNKHSNILINFSKYEEKINEKNFNVIGFLIVEFVDLNIIGTPVNYSTDVYQKLDSINNSKLIGSIEYKDLLITIKAAHSIDGFIKAHTFSLTKNIKLTSEELMLLWFEEQIIKSQ